MRPTSLSLRLQPHLRGSNHRLGAEARQALTEQHRVALPPAVYLDMDGVIVNLIDRLFGLYGVERIDGLLPRQVMSDWEPEPTLSRALGHEVQPGVVWEDIEALGAQFWAELEPLPWLDDVVHAAEAAGDVVLLTSAFALDGVTSPSCVVGKIQWVKRHLPQYNRRLVITHAKGAIVHPGSLLIDDGLHNYEAAVKSGAEPVLWPTPWNTPDYSDALIPGALAQIDAAARRLRG